MESILTIGKVSSTTDSFVPFRPITYTSHMNIEALQDLLACGDTKVAQDALLSMYGEMLIKATDELTKVNFPSNASVTIKRKSRVEVRFQGDPIGMAAEIVSSDKVIIE